MTSAATHKAAAAIIAAAAPNDNAQNRMLFQLVALTETSYGTGKFRGGIYAPNNWGGVQCTEAQRAAGVPCVRGEDTFQSGRAYPTYFRVYPSPLAGAQDMIRLIREFTGPGDFGSSDEFYDRLYGYYGAWCKGCVKTHGAAAVEAAMRKKAYKTPAGACCRAEAVAYAQEHTRARLEEIAAALGETAPPKAPGEGPDSDSSPYPD